MSENNPIQAIKPRSIKIAKMIRSEPDSLENTEDLLFSMTDIPGFIVGYIRPDTSDPHKHVLTSLFNTWSGNGADPDVPGVTRISYAFGPDAEGVQVEPPAKRFRMWTIQMSKWRVAKNKGIPFVDSTVKSGVRYLAPSWDIVMGVKKGKITEEAYTKEYLAMMERSMANSPQKWLELINHRVVAIACYCAPGNFCHRKLLIDILKKLCEKHGIEFEYMGELIE